MIHCQSKIHAQMLCPKCLSQDISSSSCTITYLLPLTLFYIEKTRVIPMIVLEKLPQGTVKLFEWCLLETIVFLCMYDMEKKVANLEFA